MIWFGTTSFAGKRRGAVRCLRAIANLSLLTSFLHGCALYSWHSPGLSGICGPHKIPLIAEELFASPLRQSRVVAEIVMTKIPQQIPATPLIICLAPTNAQQIE